MSGVSMSREAVARKILNGEFDDYHLIHKAEVIADALKVKRLEIERNLAIGEENAAKAKCDTANALLAEALVAVKGWEAMADGSTMIQIDEPWEKLANLVTRMKAHLGVK